MKLTHEVIGHDALVVNLSFASGAAIAPLVQGSPYVTMLYNGSLTPMVTAPLSAVVGSTSVDGHKVACGKGSTPTKGTKFRVEFTESDSAWVAYASEPVAWDCSRTSASAFAVQLSERFSGSVRLALANNCSTGADPHRRCTVSGQPDDQKAYEALLDSHARAVPVAGVVSHKVAPASHGATNAMVELDFSFTLAPPSAKSAHPLPELLMLAMPHHHASLQPAPLPPSKGMHRTVRGAALAVVGTRWKLAYTAPLPAFGTKNPVDPKMVPLIKSSLLNGTMKDKSDADLRFDLPPNFQDGVGDPYFGGKLLSKMAYIAVIANGSSIGLGAEAAKLVEKLKGYVEVWIKQKSGNLLLYDASWGGLISCGCSYDDCMGKCKPHCTNHKAGATSFPSGCPAMGDAGMDFGNAWYNDHHFHYGYHIYAYAVLAAFDPAWGKKNLENILVMVRDIANPSTKDPYFPVNRHKDWYMGHSWASGIAVPGGKPNFLGRNQESTSEAVNAWYAVSLLGHAVKRDDVRDLGLALLATELKSAQTYWHARSHSDIYPAGFAAGKAVGMLWSSMAQQQTWFGVATYFIHGIQMLPVTPVSEALLEPAWLAEETKVYEAACDEDCIKQGWSVPLEMAKAVHNPEGSVAAIKKLPPFVFDSANAGGNGNSRTGAYYWAATRGSVKH
jgi:endo-1,3(4)-beta-glucanase